MADAYFATVPRCPVHGQLSRRTQTKPYSDGSSLIVRTWWACAGWDGEGCDYQIADEDLDWQYLGQAGDIQSEWDRGSCGL